MAPKLISADDTDDTASNNEDACAKLWQVYNEEAQRANESFLRMWKEDMDNLLVFSGLYSAILTAFVIESYGRLNKDPTDASLALLQRIADQLSAPSGIRASAAPSPSESFTPTRAALFCNILWFLSLSLALICAFLATFVQQWARHYQEKSTLERSPTYRARLLQFLYQGVDNLYLRSVVEVIPFFLHVSLFSFFGGLVAFLHDVNSVLLWITILCLLFIIVAYVVFTILPVMRLYSVYETPLSPYLWRVLRFFNLYRWAEQLPFYYRSNNAPMSDPEKQNTDAETKHHDAPLISHEPALGSTLPVSLHLTDAQKKAYQQPQQNSSRAIKWTLKLIRGDSELLTFFEALPDVLLGSDFRLREENFELIVGLIHTEDRHFNIINRLCMMMQNANYSWFDDSHRLRCDRIFPRLCYILAAMFLKYPEMFTPPPPNRHSWFPTLVFSKLEEICRRKIDRNHAHELNAAMALCRLCEYQIAPAERILPFVTCRPPPVQQVDAEDTDLIEISTYAYLAFILRGTTLKSHLRLFKNVTELLSQYPDFKPPIGAWLIGESEKWAVTEESPSVDKIRQMNRIFSIGLDYITEFGSDSTSVIRYINHRVEWHGWTSTLGLWRGLRSQKRLRHLYYHIKNSTNLNKSRPNAYDFESCTIREIMLCNLRLHDPTSTLKEHTCGFLKTLLDGYSNPSASHHKKCVSYCAALMAFKLLSAENITQETNTQLLALVDPVLYSFPAHVSDPTSRHSPQGNFEPNKCIFQILSQLLQSDLEDPEQLGQVRITLLFFAACFLPDGQNSISGGQSGNTTAPSKQTSVKGGDTTASSEQTSTINQDKIFQTHKLVLVEPHLNQLACATGTLSTIFAGPTVSLDVFESLMILVRLWKQCLPKQTLSELDQRTLRQAIVSLLSTDSMANFKKFKGVWTGPKTRKKDQWMPFDFDKCDLMAEARELGQLIGMDAKDLTPTKIDTAPSSPTT